MKGSGGLLSGAGAYYRAFSLIFLNSLLLFAMVNVLADTYLKLKPDPRKSSSNDGAPFAYKTYHPSLAPVYPGMDENQVNQLIKETRKLSMEFESFVQFKERPTRGLYVNVDSNGFRRVKNQGPWPPDPKALNIFLFGGSTTFGYRVADHETIASHLQELLREEEGLNARVYNFGRGGYRASQERTLFEKLILQGYVPNVAIFIDGLNEFATPCAEPALTMEFKNLIDHGDMPLWGIIVTKLPIFRALRAIATEGVDGGATQKESEADDNEENRDATVKRILERYQTDKKMITVLAKAFDVKPVFVWQPIPVYEYERRYNIFGSFNYEKNAPLLAPGYKLMATYHGTGSLGDDFTWCADIQKNSKQALYVDAVHYSGELNNMIARHILKKLKQRVLPIPTK